MGVSLSAAGAYLGSISTTTYLAAASAVVGVGSTVQSQRQQSAGRQQANNAATLKARADAITQQREQAAQIRQARVAAATVDSNTNSQGAQGSSGQIGGLSSLQTQSADNQNYLNTEGSLIGQANADETTANNYYGDASVFSDVGRLAFGAAGFAYKFHNPISSSASGRDTSSGSGTDEYGNPLYSDNGSIGDGN